MNIHTPDMTAIPERKEAEEALELLRRWASSASATDLFDLDPSIARLVPGSDGVDYPSFQRSYPDGFEVDGAYKETLPDLQNGPSSLIRGAKQQIQHVGISNFRLPLRVQARTGDTLTLDIDASSHPAWTGGGAKLMDRGGRVSRFKDKFKGFA